MQRDPTAHFLALVVLDVATRRVERHAVVQQTKVWDVVCDPPMNRSAIALEPLSAAPSGESILCLLTPRQATPYGAEC